MAEYSAGTVLFTTFSYACQTVGWMDACKPYRAADGFASDDVDGRESTLK